jgi:hypothetical protein
MEALWAAEVAQAVDGVANEQAVLPDARVQALEMLRQVVANIIDPPKPAGQPSWPDQGAVDAARLRYARLKLVSGLYKRTLAPLPSAVRPPPLVSWTRPNYVKPHTPHTHARTCR